MRVDDDRAPQAGSRRGTASVVSVNPSCCTGLPHAADVVMGALATLPCCPENRAFIALHHSAGCRTLAVRPRIAKLDGVWRDTVLLERRRADWR